MGRKDFELMLKPKVILLLPLLQLQLSIRHHLLPLGFGGLLRLDVLLLFDGGIGTGLSYGVHLLGVIEQLL
jgi:hypothetical protein